MAKLEYTNDFWNYEIESDSPLGESNGHYLAFMSALRVFHAKLTLDTFTLTRTGTSPPTWSYEFEANDGRTWEQTIKVENNQVWQTFNVSDYFNEDTEFAFQRDVRKHLMDLAREIGISKLEFTFS